jgi:preprotein translocase subunit SecG
MKLETPDFQLNIAIMLGASFALLGFFGGLSANFLWWIYLQTTPDLAFTAGYIALTTFFFLCLFLLYYSNKQIKAFKEKEPENPKEPDSPIKNSMEGED